MKKTEVVYKIVTLSLIIITLIISFNNFYKNSKINKHNGMINNIYDLNIKYNDNFVFLGDSITNYYNLDEYYENIPVVNSGIGGNKTYDILDDMNNRVYIYNPTKVFLLIGINDIRNGENPKDIYNNIKKIIKNIQKNRPDAKIYIESIYPVRREEEENNETNILINKLNKKIEDYYKNTDVKYIDVHKYLIDENQKLKQEYTEDGIHLTTLAYLKITKILLPYLND